jgi:hypothetical protein
MFFRKNIKPIEEQKVSFTCNAIDGSKECDTVKNIRDYQSQINELKNVNLDELIKKYFIVRYGNMNSYIDHSRVFEINRVLYELQNQKPTTSFEKLFSEFGKEVDVYFDKNTRLKDLREKLKVEKDKLGIE